MRMPSGLMPDEEQEQNAEVAHEECGTTEQQRTSGTTQYPIDSSRLETLLSKIKKGLHQVTGQLVSAARTAHEDNKRNYEEQEKRIDNLYGDMQAVVTQLNENIVRYINSYVSVPAAKGETSSRKEGTGCHDEQVQQTGNMGKVKTRESVLCAEGNLMHGEARKHEPEGTSVQGRWVCAVRNKIENCDSELRAGTQGAVKMSK
ncbi:hypothetical protein C2845_PM01G15500 [Panicum miliaceum]|uniref:Uncharacterized protein n=1 Tax=Panicum miliaceum TaxID=4540 RepID=A0A3L6TNL1_PANMI|nr:hypothetical protein C2845_PM01G15500 [Panicum miliaceum]